MTDTARADINVFARPVYCVACIDGGEIQTVHIFSTPEKRKAWVDGPDSEHYMRFIHYDYVIDDPDRMEMPIKKLQ